MKEYINPIDIPYKYQHYGRFAHREAADPTLVLFKGRYYCFASMCGGFYWSDDLISWKWHENRNLDMYLYAPDVRQIGDWLYFCASNVDTPSIIRRTADPMSDIFETVSAPFDFWDPNLFEDDDGRVYLYWGCNDKQPLFGQEFDRLSLLPIGEKKKLIFSDDTIRGWERYNYPGMQGMDSDGTDKKPFIEGAFMTKANGTYFLQYAAPGTETATYGDGVFVSDKPLGPFVFQNNTPFSFRPAGFMTGAGHGSTIFDKYGNLWHSATARISVNRNFERRIALFPAGIDSDGVMFCNQEFADYPIVVPNGSFNPKSVEPQYMLLSYKKKALVSSSLPGHPPELAVNEDMRTWWTAVGCKGEWYCLDLGKVYDVHSIQLNFADNEVPLMDTASRLVGPAVTRCRYIDLDSALHTRYTLEGSQDGQNWIMLDDASTRDDDRSHPYLALQEMINLRYLRLTGVEMPYGQSVSLSGFRVFGLDKNGEKPERVKRFSSVKEDEGMTYHISWPNAAGAVGYNVCFGVAEDKLYHSYQVYDKNRALITATNSGQTYWCRVDSFNESGITKGISVPM